MKTVLFATDNLRPGKGLFRYALQFCHRMKTELIVLQILDPGTFQGIVQSLKSGMVKTQDRIETSLTAAALAEAGQTDSARKILSAGKKNIARLLPEEDHSDVLSCIEQKIGEPDREIYAYLQSKPDIVLAIYDSRQDISAQNKRTGGLRLWERVASELGIPCVVRPELKTNSPRKTREAGSR